MIIIRLTIRLKLSEFYRPFHANKRGMGVDVILRLIIGYVILVTLYVTSQVMM